MTTTILAHRDAVGWEPSTASLADLSACPKNGLLCGVKRTSPLATPVNGEIVEVFESPRIDTPHTHGTGCTLASATATGLAQGMAVRDAVARERRYVHEAIRTAPDWARATGR